jgi:hypothetical protein
MGQLRCISFVSSTFSDTLQSFGIPGNTRDSRTGKGEGKRKSDKRVTKSKTRQMKALHLLNSSLARAVLIFALANNIDT